MNSKTKLVIDNLNKLFNQVTLVAENIDYLSYQTASLPQDISVYDAYRIMTQSQPKWLKILFQMRDFLGRMVGIRTIKGFNQLTEDIPNIGDFVHFFTVFELEKDKLTLVIKDHHLDVCLHLRLIDDNDKQNKLYVITSVKNHNLIGKLYMVPVSVLHPFIVNRLLRNLNAKK
ncbi:DUF2867 domain-containing protein [Gilliamella apicola]|uniref:DUF2867 domain-containing protein n=1 Tax=Gilliamella apicola TaxID=1196095 RepID=A0A2V4DYE0_9GAMM|nr:DUF2867 domain-containing protein [Gilliamella apicola]PXZ05852.1 hypothetical protein DKK79_04085 [Gilliamella apicola]